MGPWKSVQTKSVSLGRASDTAYVQYFRWSITAFRPRGIEEQQHCKRALVPMRQSLVVDAVFGIEDTPLPKKISDDLKELRFRFSPHVHSFGSMEYENPLGP